MPTALPQATVELVQTLLFDVGLSTRRAVSEAARRGVRVSRATAIRIRHGEYRGLQAGEVRLDKPERCECGDKIEVKPCRRCRLERANQARAIFARLREIQARVAQERAQGFKPQTRLPRAAASRGGQDDTAPNGARSHGRSSLHGDGKRESR